MAGTLAVMKMLAAWQMWKYKVPFDAAYFSQDFNAVEHDVIDLAVEKPTVALSAVFSMDEASKKAWWRRWKLRRRKVGADWVGINLTVLPLSQTRTVAILSYLAEDAEHARREMESLFSGNLAQRKQELSRRMLAHCQNFVLSPEFVSSWSNKKRNDILDLFRRTIVDQDASVGKSDVSLFL